jgi:hypothetical protein
VKSSRRNGPGLSELRQLDDWVFRLSGEEKARKDGLSSPSRIITGGFGGGPVHHPSPHKGVFVFNGPLGKPFSDRDEKWLGPNELDFADSRNFCMLRFETLLNWSRLIEQGTVSLQEFWKLLHHTVGTMPEPSDSTNP